MFLVESWMIMLVTQKLNHCGYFPGNFQNLRIAVH